MGGGRARWVMDIKEANCEEPWVLYVSEKSLNSVPESNISLYANKIKFKT